MEKLGEVRLVDGQKCVLISEADWEEFEAFRVLFDFTKERDPEGYRDVLRGVAEELSEEFPEEYRHMVERNPRAVKYLKAFNARKGRPQALTSSQRDFIASNTVLTAKELYGRLRASQGYTGSLKTVQNYLGELRRGKSEVDRTIEL
ncbi:hypothetical protein [Streptococcus pluranimalium]|uniref:hypothetical protein n=1 Tax=Streptococcus pluranimalium TaxID=82348 RepID=UPI003F691E65